MCVALGFALWENIGYVVMYGFGTALVRAITAVPGHACFGVFMGAFYGMARRYANYGYERASKNCRRLAVLVPMVLHGIYDFIASSEDASEWVFLIFVAALAVGWVLSRLLSRPLQQLENAMEAFEQDADHFAFHAVRGTREVQNM